MILDLELELLTPTHLAERRVDEKTKEEYSVRGDEVVVLQFKPIGLRKEEFLKLYPKLKDWVVRAEVQE